MKFYMDNKLILIPLTIMIILFVGLTSYDAYMNHKLDESFQILVGKEITGIRLTKSDFYFMNEYEIYDQNHIKKILNYINRIEKDFSNKSSYETNNLTYYDLSFSDNRIPPHLSHIQINGGSMIKIALYNYEKDRYDYYQGKINLTDQEISKILFNK